MRTAIFDIETDGLLEQTTKLHSLVIRDAETGEVLSCTDNSPDYHSITEGLKALEEADLIAGHNILSFDLPALKKLYPGFEPRGTVRDTLVMSRLIYPDMKERDFASRPPRTRELKPVDGRRGPEIAPSRPPRTRELKPSSEIFSYLPICRVPRGRVS